MTRIVFAILVFSFNVDAFAIDADGFFRAKPVKGFSGTRGTSETNGVFQAVWKMDAGMMVVCLDKKRDSEDCDTQWMSPSSAVEKLVEKSCYLGFELNMGEPVFYYRVKRPCS